MNNLKTYLCGIFSIVCALVANATEGKHPVLLFDKTEIVEMKNGKDKAPIFANSINQTIDRAHASLSIPINVPVPCDGGGGVVHEQHKSNYYEMMDNGIAYQFTEDERYAKRVAEMLNAYAELYPTLGFHQLGLSNVPGRLFWQTLNESVWLVHTSIAYDCVRDYLSSKQRKKIEDNLLTPMANFIMMGTEDNRANQKTFNKMHNHGTWATAAVGMAGLAMDNKELVDKALYGTDMSGNNGGFLKQMDFLFSPDGYFTEGAYYQRYALWPFVIFAQCLDHARPELAIFDRRDHILEKALDVLYQLSYNGEFMHINDAMEKGLSAQEIIYATNILYGANSSNATLPSIAANYHTECIPCIGGYRLANAIAQNSTVKPNYRSVLLHDGRLGNEGGIGIIRDNSDGRDVALTMKATSHGLSHGHYDKLTLAFYDNGSEILSDYGAARFINLQAKNSGHYTKENDTFCKQTVAHNTLVVDRISHFGGNYKLSSKYHSEFEDFVIDEERKFSAMSASDENAYADRDVKMSRSIVYAQLPGLSYPLALDLIKVKSTDKHAYDLPFWYRGHMVSTNVERKSVSNMRKALGTSHGYQHIWSDATCSSDSLLQFTFFKNDRMYTISSACSAPMMYGTMVSLGADDPNFNLRDEKGWLVSVNNVADCAIASIIEPHGEYDVLRETAFETESSVTSVKICQNTEDYTAVELIYGPTHSKAVFLIANDKDTTTCHEAYFNNSIHRWTGRYSIVMQ